MPAGDAGPDGPPLPPGPFTLAIAQTGGGVVHAGTMDCGSTCSAQLATGTVVDLTVTPDSASAFVGWTGDCSGTGPCTLTMTADHTVGATFSSCPGMRTQSWTFGGARDQHATAVATDAAGNVLVAGTFAGTIAIGGMSLASAGEQDVFVAKLSPSGTPLWARRFGSTGDDEALAIATDSNGNAVVSGFFEGSMAVGTKTLSAAALQDAYVLELAGSDGTPIWARSFGGVYNDWARAVAVGPGNDVFVTGHFYGTGVAFGTITLDSAGSEDLFVARLAAADGTPVWATRGGSASWDTGTAIAVSSTAVAVGGLYYNQSATFGGTTVNNRGDADMLVARLAVTDGAWQWARGLGSQATDHVTGVALDATGAVLYAGDVSNDADLGGVPTISASAPTIVLGKLDATGQYVWAKAASNGFAYASGLAIASNGELVVVGGLAGSTQLGSTTLIGADPADLGSQLLDAVVARFASDGTPLSAQRFGGPGQQAFTAVAPGPQGSVYAAGTFAGTIDHCGGLATADGEDAVVVALSATAAPRAPGSYLLPPPVIPAPPDDGPSTCIAPTDMPPSPLPTAKGPPTFSAVPVSFPAGFTTSGTRAIIADVDHDGTDDAVILAPQLGGQNLYVFHNDGTGNLADVSTTVLGTPPIEFDLVGSGTVLDVNGDQRPDFFFPAPGWDSAPFPGAQARLFLSQPGGTLVESTDASLPLEKGFGAIADAADVNCDGHPDIYLDNVSSEAKIPPRLLIGSAGNVFAAEQASRLPAEFVPYGPRFAGPVFCDVNRDGAPDLVLGNAGSTPDMQDDLLLNDGHGRFTFKMGALPPRHFPMGETSWIRCVDVDLDTWPDLVVYEGSGTSDSMYVSIWMNQKDGTFLDETSTRLPSQTDVGSQDMFVADVNADGWPDLVLSGSNCGAPKSPVLVQLFLNQGNGMFTESLDAVPSDGSCVRVYPIQANGDAKIDLLRIGTGSAASEVLLNTTP